MQQHDDIDDKRIALINDGVEEAFNLYYKAYRTTFYQFTKQLVVDKEVAKDIVSDAFMACWQIRENFPTMKSLQSFMYVTCRNKAYNFLRYGSGFKNKKELLMNDLPEGSDKDTEDSVLRNIILREYTKELLSLLEKLPAQRQSVLKLLFLEGLNVEEVAQTLNISRDLVYTIKSKGLSQLRQLVADAKLSHLFLILLWWEHMIF